VGGAQLGGEAAWCALVAWMEDLKLGLWLQWPKIMFFNLRAQTADVKSRSVNMIREEPSLQASFFNQLLSKSDPKTEVLQLNK